MRTLITLVGIIACLTNTFSAPLLPHTEQGINDALFKSANKVQVAIVSLPTFSPSRGSYLDFTNGMDLASIVRTEMAKAVEEFAPLFLEGSSYQLYVSLNREEFVPNRANHGELMAVDVPLKGWGASFTYDGTVPERVYDFSSYGPPPLGYSFYLPIPAPGTKWGKIEAVAGSFRSTLVSNVNVSLPEGCWVQDDLGGNGYMYPPVRLWADGGLEMTWYYNAEKTLWRRYSSDTGLVVAESNPPPPDLDPLRLSIAVNEDGEREITLLGTGADSAELQVSSDLVDWLPVSPPPALTGKGVRKHISTVGDDGSPQQYYRARVGIGPQKQ